MKSDELSGYIGCTFEIRSVKHLCVAASKTALLLLQFRSDGRPLQYIVAHHPDWYNGELVWAQGGYYLLDRTDPSSALRDAAVELNTTRFYAAMADDDWDTHCIGVFTSERLAEKALEEAIAKDIAAREYAKDHGYGALTLADYQRASELAGLENAFWIEEKCLNQTSQH